MPNGEKRHGSVGAWSKLKLGILRCYLGRGHKGFVRATWRARERYYLDFFAGPGQNQVAETGEIIDGSPLTALKAGPPYFTRMFWMDVDRRNVVSLEAHKRDHLDRNIKIYHGDANARVHDILRDLPKRHPTFAFLDPRAAELDWRTVTELTRHKSEPPKIELFILFGYNHGLARLLPYDPGKLEYEDILDRVMPDPIRWREIYERRVRGAHRSLIRREFLGEYVRGLREQLGYNYVPPPRLIKTLDGRPLYFLIFAGDNKIGENIMQWCLKEVAWEDVSQRSLFSYEHDY